VHLNANLGNRNGRFDPNGHNFSWSARALKLDGTILRAELRTISGEWNHDNVDLKCFLGEVPTESILSLDTKNATDPVVFSSPMGSRLDLDQFFGNDNGTLDSNGTNFKLNARNISLQNRIFCAELKTVDGKWNHSSIDIGSLITWSESGGLARVENPKQTEKRNVFYDVGANNYFKWSQQITSANLCRRGWVVQERLLSPRIVHFAKEQLFWECVTMQSIEEWPREAIDNRQAIARTMMLDFKTWDVFAMDLVNKPKERALGVNYIWSSIKAMYGRNNVPFRKADLAGNTSLLEKAKSMCYGDSNWVPTHFLLKFWSAIITSYNAAELTFIEDRLIAIAGLAQIVSSRTACRYAAGLWDIQLPRQLLWNDVHVARNNIVREYTYVAPSWSWAANYERFLGKRITLDPILETKAAMDLIKILSIDVQGVAADDAMPFGRVSSGLLRIRGRLLPIALDFNAWPEGVTRKNSLVQFWTGSAPEPPTGEAFLIPVLFTRWNERLPPTAVNALLVESTAEKGVLRRIGTARLSSLCDLQSIVPQLYIADATNHEDEDDDADSEGEASEEDAELTIGSFLGEVDPIPQMEQTTKALELLKSNRIQTELDKFVATAKKKAGESRASSNPTERAKAAKLDAGLKAFGKFIAARSAILSQVPGKPGAKIHIDPEATRAAVQSGLSDQGYKEADVVVMVRNHIWRKKEIKKLEPKDAVGSQFYLDYIHDDEDVVRFGHFVFALC
jgi:hypothetical protein